MLHWRDEWPCTPGGDPYDGTSLLHLLRIGQSPFDGVWDVKLLIREIEENLSTEVTDIPTVTKGSNNYGFHIKTTDKPDMVARLARGDVNMPGFEGFSIDKQVPEARFEAAVYSLLRDERKIRVSRLVYSRVPALHPGPRTSVPQDLIGRRLFVFECARGVSNVWEQLDDPSKLNLLNQLAQVRAALFSYDPPHESVAEYLLDRLFAFMPDTLSMPVSPTRQFWMHVLESKIKATIRNRGDMIGWESDEETVGPVALAAKESLLRAVPLLLPPDLPDGSLYRFVVEHGDFGIHNTTITDEDGDPCVTSLYDWETACILPAILSNPLVAAGPVDLITDDDGAPAVTRLPEDATSGDMRTYKTWADHYARQATCLSDLWYNR